MGGLAVGAGRSTRRDAALCSMTKLALLCCSSPLSLRSNESRRSASERERYAYQGQLQQP